MTRNINARYSTATIAEIDIVAFIAVAKIFAKIRVSTTLRNAARH